MTDAEHIILWHECNQNIHIYAKAIKAKVRNDIILICRANLLLSDSAKELYNDIRAYDLYERGIG